MRKSWWTYVFDSWVCNVDRDLEGNTLLTPATNGRFLVIAADQSDCFGGAGSFADGSWRRFLGERGAAESVPFLQRAIFECGGARSLKVGLEKVNSAVGHLDEAMSAVPAEWWRETEIAPAQVAEILRERARRLPTILNIQQWEGLEHDARGGQLL
jgi:hypothetical protein